MPNRDLAVDERLVTDIWERQAFDLGALARLGLRVIFRGMPSDAGGPDYQDAVFSTASSALGRGDVEFHVCSSDWYHHGHAEDTRYNGVALHVVWLDDAGCTVRQDGVIVPTLVLACSASAAVQRGPQASPGLAPHACVSTFASLDADYVSAGLVALGWRRFQEREDRFAAELELNSPDQVLYASVLEGMGYASNRQTFLRLAEAVPYAWIMSLPRSVRVDVLLDAAGLGPPSGYSLPARLPEDCWRLSRLRPGNVPAVRIRGVVCLFERLGASPADTLTDVIASAAGPAQLREKLVAKVGDEACIGVGRADELAASVVLPFVAAHDPAVTAARTLFARYPSPPSTRWTRVMLDMMARAGHTMAVRTALDHQALHLLYTRFCRKEGASDCPLCG